MSTTIKLRRSAVAGRIPTTAQLALGELAINTADGKIYIKQQSGGLESIVEFSADPNDLLALIKTVDGAGSGLDADLLDGLNSDQFLRSDQDDTMAGSLVVQGNLTVSGTQTTVNTETLLLADNVIVVNSNATGSPTENGGIEVERGDATNKTLIWNETIDKWTVGSQTFVAATFEGDLTGDVTGDITGDLTGDVTGTVSSIANHIIDSDSMTGASATNVASAESIKSYVDTEIATAVSASDLDFQGDTGGALSIDLDSESLTIAGGTGLSSVGSGNGVTLNLDDTAVTAASYGSSTAIPVLTVNAKGLVTAASTASITTALTVGADSGSDDTVALATDTLDFSGGTGIDTTVSALFNIKIIPYILTIFPFQNYHHLQYQQMLLNHLLKTQLMIM